MPFLDQALALSAGGVPVFPCHPLTSGDKAKQPLTSHGFKDASSDPATIRAWAARWPDALVGLPTGPLTGLLVVDLDVKNGVNGLDSWRAVEAAHAPAPETFTVLTMSGGLHLYFLGAGGCTKDRIGPNIDTRGEGGYVIAYSERVEGTPEQIAPAPAWLEALVPVGGRGMTAPDETVAAFVVPASARRALSALDLEVFARQAPEPARSDARAVVAGRAWGERGARDDRLTRLVWLMVSDFPELEPHGTSELFAASCAAVEAEDGATTNTAWVYDKIQRAITAVAGRHASLAGGEDSSGYIAKARAARGSSASGVPSVAATLADLPTIAKAQSPERAAAVRALETGALLSAETATAAARAIARSAIARGVELDVPATAALFSPGGVSQAHAEALLRAETSAAGAAAESARAAHDWVLGTPQGYFLKGPDGYQGPFLAELVPARARDVLEDSGLVLTRFSRGEFSAKPAPVLLHESGTVPRVTEFTLTGETRLEADTLLYRALREPALAAQEDPAIARWLELLAGGAGPLHEALLDWLASFRRFERPTAAIFLKANPGVGKGLLVDGLCQLFGGRPVPFTEAVGPFNGAMADCPVVFADENLTAPPGVNAVDELKKLVGDSSFRVANKNVRATALRGCVRVILASNHHGSFRFGRELTEADVSALDQRVLMLEPHPDTAGYLAGLGGRDFTEAWVAGLGLARHVRWLEETRPVLPGSRFLVQGRGGLHDLLTGTSKGTSPVLRACVTAFMSGHAACLLKEGGQFWVQKRLLVDQWETLNKRDEMPDDMGAVWGLICEPGSSHVFRESSLIRRVKLKSGLLTLAASGMGLDQDFLDRAELVSKTLS